MKKILALILAAAFVLALAGCGAGQGESATVMSHQEYIDAAIDSQVTVETYVQAKQSWWEDKATVYSQDENGGYFLYSMACSEEDYAKLVDGQKALPYGTSDIVGVYYAAEKTRTFLEKPVYDEIGTLPFEGKEYAAIKHYDNYLRKLYGDYMQLPPEEKRVSHHAYDSYIEI